MKAWHFLQDNKCLDFDDGRPVRVGKWYKYRGDGPIEMCQRGMHASKSLWDALSYAQGSVICRVELGGKIIKGEDKVVAEKRKVLWWVEGEDLLWEFARRCALDVIHLWDAPEVVVKYLKTGDTSLRAAARDAARAAARDAAWAAARDAARAAARDAARDAAWDAARAAARDAAWAAALAATRGAAWAAAWAAATEKAKRRLTQMVIAKHKKETDNPEE